MASLSHKTYTQILSFFSLFVMKRIAQIFIFSLLVFAVPLASFAAERLHPGVYVEEINAGIRPIEGVDTSIPTVIGTQDQFQVDSFFDVFVELDIPEAAENKCILCEEEYKKMKEAEQKLAEAEAEAARMQKFLEDTESNREKARERLKEVQQEYDKLTSAPDTASSGGNATDTLGLRTRAAYLDDKRAEFSEGAIDGNELEEAFQNANDPDFQQQLRDEYGPDIVQDAKDELENLENSLNDTSFIDAVRKNTQGKHSSVEFWKKWLADAKEAYEDCLKKCKDPQVDVVAFVQSLPVVQKPGFLCGTFGLFCPKTDGLTVGTIGSSDQDKVTFDFGDGSSSSEPAILHDYDLGEAEQNIEVQLDVKQGACKAGEPGCELGLGDPGTTSNPITSYFSGVADRFQKPMTGRNIGNYQPAILCSNFGFFCGQDPLPTLDGFADCVVERSTDPSCTNNFDSNNDGQVDTVDIEIVALSLRSTEPITVDTGGGPELWDIQVDLSGLDGNPGTMSIEDLRLGSDCLSGGSCDGLDFTPVPGLGDGLRGGDFDLQIDTGGGNDLILGDRINDDVIDIEVQPINDSPINTIPGPGDLGIPPDFFGPGSAPFDGSVDLPGGEDGIDLLYFGTTDRTVGLGSLDGGNDVIRGDGRDPLLGGPGDDILGGPPGSGLLPLGDDLLIGGPDPLFNPDGSLIGPPPSVDQLPQSVLTLVQRIRAANPLGPCQRLIIDISRVRVGSQYKYTVTASKVRDDSLPGCSEPEDELECSNDSDCDDGDQCNGYETCVEEKCVDGDPVECEDEDECTEDACNPETGEYAEIEGCGDDDADQKCGKGDAEFYPYASNALCDANCDDESGLYWCQSKFLNGADCFACTDKKLSEFACKSHRGEYGSRAETNCDSNQEAYLDTEINCWKCRAKPQDDPPPPSECASGYFRVSQTDCGSGGECPNGCEFQTNPRVGTDDQGRECGKCASADELPPVTCSQFDSKDISTCGRDCEDKDIGECVREHTSQIDDNNLSCYKCQPIDRGSTCTDGLVESGNDCPSGTESRRAGDCFSCEPIVDDTPSCPSGTTADRSSCESQCDGGTCSANDAGCYSCTVVNCPSGTTKNECPSSCANGCDVVAEEGSTKCYRCKQSCDTVCSAGGFDQEGIDWSDYIQNELNQHRCVQGASITVSSTTTSGCKCSSVSGVSINVDTTPVVCTGTPCGDVPCDGSVSCPGSEPGSTLTVSCNWGGWKKIDVNKFIPQVGN
jgi:hypothetical protein